MFLVDGKENLLKSDDEEDLIFDHTSLLNKEARMKDLSRGCCPTGGKLQIARTVNLCLSFFGLGLCFAIPTATLVDLQKAVNADENIKNIYTARYSGYLFGALIGGFLFDRYNRQFLLFLSLLATAVGILVMPFCQEIAALMVCTAVTGITMGFLDTGGNVWCLDLWGRKSAPIMQTLHFCFGLGAFVAPIVAEPFLSPHLHSTHAVIICNESYINGSHVYIPRVGLHRISLQSTKHARHLNFYESFYETDDDNLIPRIKRGSNDFEWPANSSNISYSEQISANELSPNYSDLTSSELPYSNAKVSLTRLMNSNFTDGTTVSSISNIAFNVTKVPNIGNVTFNVTTKTTVKPKPIFADGNQLKTADKWDPLKKDQHGNFIPSDIKKVATTAKPLTTVATTVQSINSTVSLVTNNLTKIDNDTVANGLLSTEKLPLVLKSKMKNPTLSSQLDITLNSNETSISTENSTTISSTESENNTTSAIIPSLIPSISNTESSSYKVTGQPEKQTTESPEFSPTAETQSVTLLSFGEETSTSTHISTTDIRKPVNDISTTAASALSTSSTTTTLHENILNEVSSTSTNTAPFTTHYEAGNVPTSSTTGKNTVKTETADINLVMTNPSPTNIPHLTVNTKPAEINDSNNAFRGKIVLPGSHEIIDIHNGRPTVPYLTSTMSPQHKYGSKPHRTSDQDYYDNNFQNGVTHFNSDQVDSSLPGEPQPSFNLKDSVVPPSNLKISSPRERSEAPDDIKQQVATPVNVKTPLKNTIFNPEVTKTPKNEDATEITTSPLSTTVKPNSTDLFNTFFEVLHRNRLGKFEIPYIILAMYIFIIATVFLVFLCKNPREPRSRQLEELSRSRDVSLSFRVVMVGLMSLFLCLYVGMEVGVGELLETFATKETLQLSPARGYFLPYLFWGSFAVARGVSIFVATRFTGRFMLLTNLLICIAASVLLAAGADKLEALLWVGVVMLGSGMAPLFPTSISWLEHYLHITNKTASIFVLGAAIGELIIPIVIDMFINQEPMVLMYVNIIVNALCFVSFIILCVMASKHSGKYQNKPKRSMYHLASTDDFDDGTELVSNSSERTNGYHLAIKR